MHFSVRKRTNSKTSALKYDRYKHVNKTLSKHSLGEDA